MGVMVRMVAWPPKPTFTRATPTKANLGKSGDAMPRDYGRCKLRGYVSLAAEESSDLWPRPFS